MSGKKFLNLLLSHGCEEISIRGSHHKVENTTNGKRSVVSVHGGKDIKKSLMADILTQLEIDSNDILN